MRIPVTQADLDSGRFTKISRSLAKAWPLGKLPLMQAQDTLARMLGYRSLHELQQEAKRGHPVGTVLLSRIAIADAAAWKLSRHALIPFVIFRRRLHEFAGQAGRCAYDS